MTMGQYTQLGTVRTWYGEQGQGDPLVLMHGGLVDARFFDPNIGPLGERFHVFTRNGGDMDTPPMWRGRSRTS
jgi:hypothetical protein